MRTDDLIRALAADTERTRPVREVLIAAMLLATGAAAAIFLPMVGSRPDLWAALGGVRVLVKQAWPIVLALAAAGAALRLARPGTGIGRWGILLLVVPLVLLAAMAAELMTLPRSGWMPAFIGHSIPQCLSFITLMSLPMLAVALWALRAGASTRPALSGAVGGLMSAAAATSVYAVHCTEDSPLFYGFWYVLAILAIAGLGALFGARLLRW